MASQRTRRAAVLAAVSILMAGLVAAPAAAAPPAQPEGELYAPDGNHGDPSRRIATNQMVTVEGSVDPNRTSFQVLLHQRDAGGQVVKTNDITSLVSPDSEGNFSTEVDPIEAATAETVHVRVTVTNPEGTRTNAPDQLSFLTIDRVTPRISAYALTSATTIRVTFSEDVWHPNLTGDNPNDWTVTSDGGGSQTPIRVEQGAGQNVRTLHLRSALDPNDTPTVNYEASLFRGSFAAYEDEVQQELDLAGREQEATDEVPPDPPTIDQIDGQSTPARGNDTTPTIRVAGLEPGDTAEVLLERGTSDTSMGTATAGSDETAIVTVAQPLGDGDPPETYSFYARATDANGNASDPGPQADYTLDTVAPFPEAAVVDPDETGDETTVAVFFSEAISGTDGAGQWSLTGCATGCPSIVAVTGADGSNERRLEADGAVPEGAQLAWDPPATGGYADEAGNPMDAFDGLDVDADLPAFLEAVTAGTVSEGPSGSDTVATFTVRLTEPTTSLVLVTWQTADGTAVAGDDYESDSGLLAFLPGQTEQEVDVTVHGDSMDEPDEAFSIVLGQSQGAPVDDDGRAASATIVDDDPAPTVSLAGDAGLPEGDGDNTFTLPVSLAAPSGKQVTVGWTTSGGTATAGQDYRSASGTLTFEPGATSASIPLEIIGDTVGEQDETFRVRLTSATNATLGTDTATVTIVNDDPTALRARDASVAEPPNGSVLVDVRVTAVPPPTETATVAWETVDGTATAGQDYDAASGTLTFEPGVANRTAQIRVHANGDGDSDETFRVRLSAPTGDVTIADPEAVVTIGLTSASAACPPGMVPALTFEDVSGTHADNVACASWYTIALGKGDLDGDGRPEYDPGGFVTRAQMASFIARLALEGGVDLPASPPDAFPDDDRSVHSTAIDQLAAVGIVKGRADTGDADGDGDTSEVLYFPSEHVTRAQMASFIARVHAEAAAPLPAGSNAFEDDDASVHREAIDAIAAAGIVNGRRDATDADRDGDREEILYFPAERVRRGQMATFLMQDLGELVDDGAAYLGGAETTLDTSSVAPGGQVSGEVATNKAIRSLVADGCGVDERTVTVGADGRFSVTIPSGQPSGTCTLELTVTTRRSGSQTDQAVVHPERVTVR